MKSDIFKSKIKNTNLIIFPCYDKKPFCIKGHNELTESVPIPDFCDVAYLCGEKTMIVIDVDFYKELEYKIHWDNFINKNGELDTLTEKSPKGGLHYYFLYNANFPKRKIGLYKYIDVLSTGGYCVGGDSEGYEVINDTNINEMPEFLIEFLNVKYNKKENKTQNINKKISMVKNNYINNLKKIDNLVNKIEIEYCDNYDDWFKITCCLYNIIKDKTKAYEIWDKFSKKSEKYNKEENDYIWNKLKESNYTISTLIDYTKKKKEDDNNIIPYDHPILNTFNPDDEYDFCTFKIELLDINTQQYINENLHRVAVLVNGNIITKQPLTEYNSIFKIEEYKLRWEETVGIYERESKIKTNSRPINIPTLIGNNPTIINKYKNLKTEFITKDTILNKDDFYITQPFLIKYIKKEERNNEIIEFWNNYIKEIICNNDNECYLYLNKWLSFIMKYPNLKSKIALALISLEGCGKGRFVEFLVNFIFGKFNCKPNLAGFDELFGNFNSDLLGKKLIVVNEMANTQNTFRNNFDKLKTLITDNDMKIHEKYKTPFDTKQSFEFILCSNNLNSLNISITDRRYFCLKTNDKYRKDLNKTSNDSHNIKCIEFWNKYNKLIMNQQSANMIYSYYIDMDIGKEFIGSIIPNTELKKEIQEINKQSPELYMDYLKTEIDIENHINNKIVDGISRYNTRDIYNHYESWCKDNGEKCFRNKNFSSFIKKSGNVEYMRSGGSWYIFKL